MIDLHVHLDGSVRPETIIDLAREQNIILPTDDPVKMMDEHLAVSVSNKDMAGYLKRFDLTYSVLQTKRAIRRAMYELVVDLDAQGLIYAEIRLLPQSHLLGDLTQSQVVEAALEGMRAGMADSDQIKTNLILCTMRGADEKDNFATIVEAVNHMNNGVCGLDMLGDEMAYDNDMYEGQFRLLTEEMIPFTIHCGVTCGAESIYKALDYGAKRIGHGLRAYEDPELMKILKERQILLEMCPTSNIKTSAVDAYANHPVKSYLDAGLNVTIGADDMVNCATTLGKEYEHLRKHLGMTDADIYQMNVNAANAAFLSGYEKRMLLNRLEEIWNHESFT